MARYTHKQVLARLEHFNLLTGTNFETTYKNGGWDMFIKNENGGESRRYFGFDDRKTTAEFMEYLNGLNTAFSFIGSEYTRSFINREFKK